MCWHSMIYDGTATSWLIVNLRQPPQRRNAKRQSIKFILIKSHVQLKLFHTLE